MMKRLNSTLLRVVVYLLLSANLYAIEPVVELLFENKTTNYGLSGGIGEIVNISGMQPGFSAADVDGSFCLDNTSAASMGGSSGYVRFANTSKLASQFTDLRSFTIMGWMKSDVPPGGYAGIVAFSTLDAGFMLRCYPANRLRLSIDPPNGDIQYFYSNTSANFNAADWKFFAVTYDGTQSKSNVRFYYGINDGTGHIVLDQVHDCDAGTIFMSPAWFYVANVNGAGTNGFDGYLDSIRVFGSKFDGRAALDEAAISQWKLKNSLDTKRLCVLDMRFEGNVVSEGTPVDIGFMRDHNGTLPTFPNLGVDGGRCLDLTVSTGMGNRGPFVGFYEPYDGYGMAADIHQAKSFTLMGWIKSPHTPSSNAVLFSYLDGSGRGFEVFFPLPNRLGLRLGPATYTSHSSANYSCSQWKFFAVTYDGSATSNNIKFYYGLDDGTNSVVLDSVASTSLPFVMGDMGTIFVGNRGTVLPFDGYSDSLKLFVSKDDGIAALSVDEIGNYKNDHETSIVYVEPDNRIRKSDVAIMRTGSAVATTGFAANRVVWNYTTHAGVVDAFAALGVMSSQTHNFEATAYDGTLNYLDGKNYSNDPARPSRTRDIEGQLVEKVGFPGQYYPSVTSSAFQDDTLGRLNDFLLPLNPFTIQYDTPLGDRHAAYLGYSVGFDASTLEQFRVYLQNKYTNAELLDLFNIADIMTFNYKDWLAVNYSISTNTEYQNHYSTLPLTPDFEYSLEDTIVDVFTEIKNRCTSSTRSAKLSANLAHFRYYNRVLISVLDFYNLELARARTLGVLDEQDAVSAKLAEIFDKPMFAVNDWRVSEYIKLNAKPNYMKCLIAAIYANGQMMQAPWNIWAGGESRYYSTPEVHGAFFHFIRNQASCFDDYQSHSRVGLIWNSDIKSENELYNQANPLLSLNIPFDIVPLGDRYPYSRFDVDVISERYEKFVLANDYNGWSASNRSYIDNLSAVASVVSDASLLTFDNEWIDITGVNIPDVWVLPRKHSTNDSAERIIHLLNRSYDVSTDGINTSGCTISFHRDVFDQLRVASITWLGPETPAIILPIHEHQDTISITLPQTPIWSLLKVIVFSRSDFNQNGYVNIEDLMIFAEKWLKCNNPSDIRCTDEPLNADLNADGYVDISDFAIFANDWLK